MVLWQLNLNIDFELKSNNHYLSNKLFFYRLDNFRHDWKLDMT